MSQKATKQAPVNLRSLILLVMMVWSKRQITAAAVCQWRRRLSACIRAGGGHYNISSCSSYCGAQADQLAPASRPAQRVLWPATAPRNETRNYLGPQLPMRQIQPNNWPQTRRKQAVMLQSPGLTPSQESEGLLLNPAALTSAKLHCGLEKMEPLVL